MLVIIYIILLLYLIYFIWLIEPFFKKNILSSETQNYPFVSVIISAKNEEKNLDNLMKGLLAQEYPNHCYEIIIANDKSTDQTLNKLYTLKNKSSQIIIINIENTPKNCSSKKWAINKCIENSNC